MSMDNIVRFPLERVIDPVLETGLASMAGEITFSGPETPRVTFHDFTKNKEELAVEIAEALTSLKISAVRLNREFEAGQIDVMKLLKCDTDNLVQTVQEIMSMVEKFYD